MFFVIKLKNVYKYERKYLRAQFGLVQWWSLSNGTFSLKYRLEFVDGLVECWFSKTDPHWFYYFTRNGDYIALRFEFVYNFYNMTVFTVKGSK